MHNLYVKICGLTRSSDALLAAELGASALGFIFYPPSPRALSLEAARNLITELKAKLSPEIMTSLSLVGVFVNADNAEMLTVALSVGLSHLQLHGHESPEQIAALQAIAPPDIKGLYKALRLERPADLEQLERYEALTHPPSGPPVQFLIDAAVPGWGGSGQQADWPLARQAAQFRPILLAGGIQAENLELALQTVRPWGLDLSSGVENTPGIKDPDKLRDLFKQLQAWRSGPDIGQIDHHPTGEKP